MLSLIVNADICKTVVFLFFFFFLLAATSDVKEAKDSEKKADPLKEPPLESDALVRVTLSITVAHLSVVSLHTVVTGVSLRAISFA